MSDNQQPPDIAMDKFRKSMGFQINFILYSGLDVKTAVEHICSAAETLVNNARVHPVDDARVAEIRERRKDTNPALYGDATSELGSLGAAKSDIDYLLSLLPELSSSKRRCGECRHSDELDPNGRCMSVYYDAGNRKEPGRLRVSSH